MSDVREVMFSAGSACASESGRPSHILAAIGLTTEQARLEHPPRLRALHHEEELERAAELINDAAAQQDSA